MQFTTFKLLFVLCEFSATHFVTLLMPQSCKISGATLGNEEICRTPLM